jgi:predicted Zn-dependent peptidase
LSGQTLSAERGQDSVFNLSNGLKVIYQNNKASEITVCQILIKGGKRAEPSGMDGLSYLTTRLSLEIPDRNTIQDIMDQATQLNMGSRMDYSQINISCLSDNYGATIELVSQILLKPLFSGIRITNIKDMMTRSREYQEDDPLNVAHQAVLDRFFAGTPYSISAYGTEESLKEIKKRDVKSFYNTHFRALNMAIAVSSDLNQTTIEQILEAHFKDTPSGAPEPDELEITARVPEERILSLEKDTQQTLVLLAFPLPKISSRHYIMANILNNLLGQGVNSKLWPLRVKEQLAYNVNSRVSMYAHGGVLEVYLETENIKKNAALKALRNVLNDLYENGLSEDELETTQAFYRGTFLRQNETKENRTQSLLYFEALGLGHEFMNQVFKGIKATTLEEINGFVKEVLNPETSLEIVVGPVER